MIKLKIDNNEYLAPEGSTVFKVALDAGKTIPTLCYKDGLPHYSSCMVCMVKDIKSNRFIPSCSAMAMEGMDIDASGEEVLAIRKRAIELLLAEHRAECEAPCRIVCPGGYNIPLMNRLISSRDFEGAVQLVREETIENELNCINCTAFCENACRRKKIDSPVSIRNTRLFIYNEVIRPESGSRSPFEKNKKQKRFSSRTGKLDEKEIHEWLKECNGGGHRVREITSPENAYDESQSCMHCDCRAAEDCKLRELGEMLQIKDSADKKIVNAPAEKQINKTTGLIFENAKCIKCGLCIRVCEDSTEAPALCFLNRGFVSIISAPLTTSFDEVLLNQAREAIEVCPTGALAWFRQKETRKETK